MVEVASSTTEYRTDSDGKLQHPQSPVAQVTFSFSWIWKIGQHLSCQDRAEACKMAQLLSTLPVLRHRQPSVCGGGRERPFALAEQLRGNFRLKNTAQQYRGVQVQQACTDSTISSNFPLLQGEFVFATCKSFQFVPVSTIF